MKTPCTLITGSGDGLGRSFALYCASLGHNLVLIALPGTNLGRLAKMIGQHYGVQVFFLEVDLCQQDGIDRVMDHLLGNNLAVNFLINNAGMGHSQAFEELSPQFIDRELELNIHVPTTLTHRLLPIMKDHVPGHIIYVSSFASFFPLPLKNTYVGSKAYTKQFSLSLRGELKPYGIGVSVVCPSGIVSNITQYMLRKKGGLITRLSYMHPDDVAAYTVKKTLAGKRLIVPGRINRVIRFLTSLFPDWLKDHLATKFIKPVKPQAKNPAMTAAA